VLKNITVWVCLAGISVSACGRLSPVHQRFGVEPRGAAIGIVYAPCPGEQVRGLTLWQLDGDNIAGNDGDTVIWTGSTEELLTAESTVVEPATESGPIELEDDLRYFVVAETTQGGGSTDAFVARDLIVGHVYVNSGTLTEQEFRDNASNSCG